MRHRVGPIAVRSFGTGSEKPGQRVVRGRGSRKTLGHFAEILLRGIVVTLGGEELGLGEGAIDMVWVQASRFVKVAGGLLIFFLAGIGLLPRM